MKYNIICSIISLIFFCFIGINVVMAIQENLTLDEYKLLQNFIYNKSGMFFPVSRKGYIEKRVLKRMEALRFERFDKYFEILKKEILRTEIINLFNIITINETFFFRDLPQLKALKNHIVPELLKSGKKNINILSAGCSSGEEAHSLAIIMRENFPGVKFSITGIDISDLVIAKAKRGEFSDYAVRFVPKNYFTKYFTKLENGNFKFKDEFKGELLFKKENLIEFEQTDLKTPFDIVFCRYVLIYFDKESKKGVVKSFYNNTSKNGYLIMGNSESLFSVSEDYQMLHFPSAIMYKRRD